LNIWSADLAEAGGVRVVLIGGTSHAGKSSLAAALAAAIGGEARSTDKLARHPGRPWRNAHGEAGVPPHVAEHYGRLEPDELYGSVMRHYVQNVWPLVESLVAERAADQAKPPLVLEGSAILPDRAVALASAAVRIFWLAVDDDLVARRIRNESRWRDAGRRERALIEKFIARSQVFNREMAAAARRVGLAFVEASHDRSPEALALDVLRRLDR
jgi:2-phosphoglycerate kinase